MPPRGRPRYVPVRCPKAGNPTRAMHAACAQPYERQTGECKGSRWHEEPAPPGWANEMTFTLAPLVKRPETPTHIWAVRSGVSLSIWYDPKIHYSSHSLASRAPVRALQPHRTSVRLAFHPTTQSARPVEGSHRVAFGSPWSATSAGRRCAPAAGSNPGPGSAG